MVFLFLQLKPRQVSICLLSHVFWSLITYAYLETGIPACLIGVSVSTIISCQVLPQSLN